MSTAKPKKLGRSRGSFTQAKRFERLKNALMNHPAGLPLPEIARLLNVTQRSVRRYLKEMNRLEELVESVPSREGNSHLWRIKPQEQSRQILLRQTQAHLLLATRKLFSSIKGTASFDEMEIVLAAMKRVADRPLVSKSKRKYAPVPHFEQRFFIVPQVGVSTPQYSEVFDEVFYAAAEQHVLSGKLKMPEGNTREVMLRVYAIFLWGKEVLLLGVHHDDLQLFLIPLSGISEAQRSETERFKLPPEFSADDYVHGVFGIHLPSKRKWNVVLEFEPSIAETLKKTKVHPTQKTAIREDGRMRISFDVPNLECAESWILSFGSHVQVIAPKELAQKISVHAKKMNANYKL